MISLECFYVRELPSFKSIFNSFLYKSKVSKQRAHIESSLFCFRYKNVKKLLGSFTESLGCHDHWQYERFFRYVQFNILTSQTPTTYDNAELGLRRLPPSGLGLIKINSLPGHAGCNYRDRVMHDSCANRDPVRIIS